MNEEQDPPPIFVAPGAQPPPGYVPYYPGPSTAPKRSNGNATASLIVSGGSLAMLFFTGGLFAPLTAIASIVGTILGHKAKVATDQDGELGQRDEAVAGFWMGISGIILSVLAIIFWVIVIVVFVSFDQNTSIDGETFFDDSSLQ